MTDNKLLLVLASFSKEEMRQFEKFLSSDYFGCKKFVIPYFTMLKKYHPEFKHGQQISETIFNKIYPGRKNNDSLLRKINSFLLGYSETFLAYNQFGKRKTARGNMLLTELRERNLHYRYEVNYKNLEKELETSDFNTSENYLNSFITERERIDYLLNNNEQAKAQKHISRGTESLIYHFMNYIVNMKYIMHANANAFNQEYSSNILNKFISNFNFPGFIKVIEEESVAHPEVLEYEYYKLMMLLKPETEIYYFECKNLTNKYPHFFQNDIKLFLYFKLIAYCMDKLNNCVGKYEKEAFENYRVMLSPELNYKTFYYGHFSASSFRNIILCGIGCGEYKWLDSFINEYAELIEPEYRETMKNYGLAFKSYISEDFGSALKWIEKTEFKNVIIRIDLVNLKMKIFYELGYYEELYSLIDTQKRFLSKNPSVSENIRAGNLNFCRYLKRLAVSGLNDNLQEVSLLENLILKNPKTINRNWLLEKIKKLD